MTSQTSTLAAFGWTHFFASQLEADDLNFYIAARVMAVHRGQIAIAAPDLDRLISSRISHSEEEEAFPTIGDWLLVDRTTYRPKKILQRSSVFKRRASGTGRKVQLIAANVDTVFIVSSCNQDFNIPRLERYLVLAREAGVTPIIVLTKTDLIDNPEDYAQAARQLQSGLLVETVNALCPKDVVCLTPWCSEGQTIALLGSSGVGKSTLVSTLIDDHNIATQAIRHDDDKGRHTTTGRALYRLPQGGWLLDTPGMRELQLTDVSSGVETVFADIFDLTKHCRFKNCSHESEPDCAVQRAIADGVLDADRLKRWRKLKAEERHNRESLAERHSRDRAFGKMIKNVVMQKQK